MTGMDREFRAGLRELADLARGMSEGDLSPLEEYADLAARALARGGKLLFCGNGGSAADAQHVAAEYVVRMEMDRAALPALALTTDTSVLTAGSNDRGFDEVFARQVEALGNAGDVLVLHSTSGESENLLKAAAVARGRGVHTVALLARGGGRLRAEVDVAIIVPTDTTSRAQELHLALSHIVCRFVEARLARPDQLGGPVGPELLQDLRRREKAQTLFYRRLAAEAEAEGRADLVERLNELHADEQHHLSRLTARLMELGEPTGDPGAEPGPETGLEGWEKVASERERGEVEAYERALENVGQDDVTRAILEEILASERQHLDHLGGKWMPA